MDFSWMKLSLDTFVFLLLSKFHLYWLKHVKFCIVLFTMRCCAWVCLFFFRLFCFPKLCRYGWKRAWFCPTWCLTCMLCSTSPVHANAADTVFLYHLYQLQSQCMMFPWSPKPTTCAGRKRTGLINPGSLAWKIAMVWTGNCQKDWYTRDPSVNIKNR